MTDDDDCPPKAINQILREHTGSRLYVHPIAWTEAQQRLLQIRFSKESASRQMKSTKRKGKGGGDLSLAQLSLGNKGAMVKAVEGLSSPSRRIQRTGITNILCEHGLLLQQSSRLPFRFNKSVVDRLCTSGIYLDAAKDVSVVFVFFDIVQKLQNKYLARQTSQAGAASTTAAVSQERNQKNSTASDVATNPYISAALTGSAQEIQLRRKTSKSMQNHDGAIKTHVIALPETSATQIYLYTATFQTQHLLYHLEYPNEPGDWDPVSIAWSTIGLRDAERVTTRLSRYIQKTILSSEP